MSEKTKILFLDDDPSLLAGLERSLSQFRAVWDMRFETSPIQALENFMDNRVDVVVIDIKMPELEGDIVANLFGSLPDAPAVIILSGHASQKELESRISVPFLFLEKPCNQFDLIRCISQSLYSSSSRISALYDDVLEVVVRKLRHKGVLDFEELPPEYTAMLDIRSISRMLGELSEGTPLVTPINTH